MSRDHKPTDPEEYVRIKNAGGFVSDGRVNGCLNLSRALGDMEYKKSPKLAPEEYMITANPDIKTMDLQSGDQFLILACDGIWDVLSDQEACDFVNFRLTQNYSLLSIAEEMCDFCLAEDADGSGEGCDNMTAMIVMLKDYSQCYFPCGLIFPFASSNLSSLLISFVLMSTMRVSVLFFSFELWSNKGKTSKTLVILTGVYTNQREYQ